MIPLVAFTYQQHQMGSNQSSMWLAIEKVRSRGVEIRVTHELELPGQLCALKARSCAKAFGLIFDVDSVRQDHPSHGDLLEAGLLEQCGDLRRHQAAVVEQRMPPC